MSATIVWFRNDLRVDDNPALDFAVRRGEPVVPLFVWSEIEEGEWRLGGASRWWLHHALSSLDRELQTRGAKLLIRRRDSSLRVLSDVIKETGANAVVWNRRYEPRIIERDAAIKQELLAQGINAESFNGTLLVEPWRATKQDGTPYQVYTPFWKNQLAKGFGTEPLQAPDGIRGLPKWPSSLAVEELQLLPKIEWDGGFSIWRPGSIGAHEQLGGLLDGIVERYGDTRNLPGIRGTSRLSPHLHFGEISSNRIVHEIRKRFALTPSSGVETYVKEIFWREFGYNLLFHFPHTTSAPLNRNFERFPWAADPAALKAWQRGETGYPIVDAGMRELWNTGWMHNRVRMIVASFLVKHLLIRWQEGAAWFWDTLVDADLASNTMGWQWSAGCGADAAPYFRIFNPMLQSAKFDPDGAYIKRWCPELAQLSAKAIHAPWEADKRELEKACVVLGKSYPRPIVDHEEGRKRALAAYAALKS